MSTLSLSIRGVRGGRPAIGPAFARYGAHTTSFSVELPDGFLVFDTGTGISSLSNACLAAGPDQPIHIFYTHFHFDHTLGLRGFEPIYRDGYTVHFYGVSPSDQHVWPDLLTSLFDEPYWPVPLRHLPAQVTYHDLDELERPLQVLGVGVSWCELAHTQRCLGYRIDRGDRRIAILTDHEPQLAPDDRTRDFCAGADLLVMDGQYRPDEYATCRGWGHGTWQDAVALAEQAGVKQLLLCHHDPTHTDADLDAIERQAQAVFADTRLAREGTTVQV